MAPPKDKATKAGADKPAKGGAEKAGKEGSKKTSKYEKAAAEAARKAERDRMLYASDNDDLDGSDEEGTSLEPPAQGGDGRARSPPRTDKFGNTLSKADAAKTAKEAEIERMRAEARARREAKATAAAVSTGAESELDPAESRKQMEAELEQLRTKAAAGGKLSGKEKKQLKQLEARAALAEGASAEVEVDPGLSAFSLSVRGAKANDGEVADGDAVSATDVIVPCFSIAAPARPLFTDAALRLASGRRYGLLGPNGHGKSTLLRFLAARRLPVPTGVDVLLVEQEVKASPMAVYEQVLAADTKRADLMAEEKKLTAAMDGAEAAEVCVADGREPTAKAWTDAEWAAAVTRLGEVVDALDACGADAAEPRARRILSGLGFSRDMAEAGSEGLSGGWRMRVSLARALFLQPRLLLLDEPTNHLDLDAVLWLEDHLAKRWKGTILSVSHDIDFLSEVCTDLLNVDAGAITHFGGSIHKYGDMRRQLEAKKAKDYEKQQKLLRELKKGGLPSDKATKEMLKKLDMPLVLDRPREYTVRFAFRAAEDQDGAISLMDVAFAYAADGLSGGKPRELFRDLSFKIDGTSRVALAGPNGSGKTTLARLIAGDLEPTAGEVARSRRLRLGHYHQHFEELLPMGKSPVAYLREAFSIEEQEARKYLGMFGLDGARHLIKMGELSGGQKARVVFANLALQQPHVLLLDEPTNHLDIESVEALVDGLKEFQGGVLLISHDARLISALECELWVCGEGASGLRVEHRGFDRYRSDILQLVEKRAQEAAAEAEERAARQKAARQERLKHRRAGRHGRDGGSR